MVRGGLQYNKEKLEKSNLTIKRLEAEIKKFMEDKEKYGSDLARSQAEGFLLEENFNNTKEELEKKLEVANKELEAKIKEFTTDKEKYGDDLARSEAERLLLKQNFDDTKEKLVALKQELEVAKEAKLGEKNKISSKKLSIIMEPKKLAVEASVNTENEIEEIREPKKVAMGTLVNTETDMQEINKEKSVLNRKIRDFEDQISLLKQANGERLKSEDELRKKEASILRFQGEIDVLKRKLEDFERAQRKMEGLERELQNVISLKDSAQEADLRHNEEVVRLRQQLELEEEKIKQSKEKFEDQEKRDNHKSNLETIIDLSGISAALFGAGYLGQNAGKGVSFMIKDFLRTVLFKKSVNVEGKIISSRLSPFDHLGKLSLLLASIYGIGKFARFVNNRTIPAKKEIRH